MEHDMNRERASSIILSKGDQPLGLTLIGAGNTCLVYRTENYDIIKEFSPVIAGRVAMSRKQSADGPLSVVEGLSALDRAIVQERWQGFLEEYSLVKELYSGYQQRNDNMFLVPEQKRDTSLGLCHWCRYTGGDTLDEVFAQYRLQSRTFQDYLELVLPLVITLFDELAYYHQRDILNLDVKPDNLFAIKFNGKYIGIRNLDFGSARRAGELPGLIREYAVRNRHLSGSVLIGQINARFFASSMPYYDRDRINGIIQRCLEGEQSDGELIKQLKMLDVLAAFKVLLSALDPSGAVVCDALCEADAVYRQLLALCTTQDLSESASAFENYNVFFLLYKIYCSNFRGGMQYKLDAQGMRESLSDLLCILQGIDENSRTERQMLADLQNRALIRNEHLLAQYSLKSVAQILQFWKEQTGLVYPPSPQELMWLLRYGYARELRVRKHASSQVGQRIDPGLFADISVGNVQYQAEAPAGRTHTRIERAPLIKLWHGLPKDQSLWLEGTACAGKSVALRALESELIWCAVPTFYYDCKELAEDDLQEFGNELEGRIGRTYLIDHLEALPEELLSRVRKTLSALLGQGCRLVIASRGTPEEFGLCAQHFVRALVQPFSQQRVRDALGKGDVSEDLCALLSTPMMLGFYMEEKGEKVVQAGLLKRYFEKLLQSNGAAQPVYHVLEKIGAYYLGRGRAEVFEHLSGALLRTFVDERDKGPACAMHYRAFCMAVYLEKCMVDHPELMEGQGLSRLLDLSRADLTQEHTALVGRYTGELLTLEAQDVRNSVRCVLSVHDLPLAGAILTAITE